MFTLEESSQKINPSSILRNYKTGGEGGGGQNKRKASRRKELRVESNEIEN